MSDMQDYAIKITESVAKELTPIAIASAKSFFKYQNLDILSYAKNSYFNERFRIRLEDFISEEDKLSNKEKENFYQDINNEKLNYLFELLNNARIATFDVHAKILSKIYFNLLKNGTLNEYDIILLININRISLKDFTILNRAINNLNAKPKYALYLKTDIEVKSLQRFMDLGIFNVNNEAIMLDKKELSKVLAIKLNDFGFYMKKVMENII